MTEPPRPWFARLQSWLLLRRVWVLVFFAGLGIGTGVFFPQVRFESSVESMVLQDDPDLAALREFEKVFGSDETFMVALSTPEVFATGFLEDLEELRRRVAAIAPMRECRALTNLSAISGTEDTVEVGSLVPEIPRTAAGLAALRERALARRDYVGFFYNEAGDTATVLARVELPADLGELGALRAKVVGEVRALLAEPRFAKYPSFVAGGLVIKTDLSEYQRRDNRRFQVLVYLLIVGFLFLSFRRAQAVVLALVVVQISIFVILAQLHLSGRALNVVGSILTPLLLIYGISISSHLFNRYLEWIPQSGGDQRRALIAAISSVALASFYNAVTTAAGFGSNMVSQILPVRTFGRDAALGVLVVFVVGLAVAAPLLSLFRMPAAASVAGQLETGPLARFLARLADFNLRHRWAIVAVNLLILAGSIAGISQIRVETKLIEYFREDTDIRRAWTLIEEKLTGVSTVEVMIRTPAPDGAKDPALLARVDALQQWLGRHPRVDNPVSVVNILAEMNRALSGDPGARVPASRELAAQLLLLYESSDASADLWSYVDPQYQDLRLSARLKTIPSSELVDVVRDIKAQAHAVFAADEAGGVEVAVTGSAVLYANMVGSLVRGQMQSFGLSLLLIALLMILVAREIGLGLLSLLPNVLPIGIIMGVMGFAGIPLDATTATIAPIALGMAVDSTIHYMVRFRREHLACGDRALAMRRTLATVGRAMFASSVPLAAGFAVLCTSSFKPTYYFGILSGAVVVLAMIYDLVATPVVLLLYTPRYERRGRHR
jgi:hypothetical protein